MSAQVVHLDKAGPAAIARFVWDERVVAIIKEIPGREWKPAYKVWTVPPTVENMLLLKERLASIGWQLSLEERLRKELNETYRRVKEAGEVRAAGDSDIAFEFKTEPYAHQRAGLAFLARLGSGALFWEMGLGKTKTAIDYAEWLNKQPYAGQHQHHVLVIAPNTVKRNWAAEIEKHAGHNDWIVPMGTIDKRITQLQAARYTILNCEVLSIGKMAKALLEREWDLVIVDESTRFKTPGAERTKALLKLAKAAPRRVILTGTPITGKPEDAWAQLEIVQPGMFGTFYRFKDTFLAVHPFFKSQVVGIKPGMETELKKRIDSRGYRILKSQVLDLPPKVYVDRTVEMTGDQLKAYRQMRDELRIEIENMPKATAANILTLILRLTQVTAGMVGASPNYHWLEDGAKVRELDDLLNDELRGEQVVIYGQYQFELEQLAKRYAAGETLGEMWPIIYGPTPERQRQLFIEDFQQGRRRLLFVQTRTGGIGITLTAAKTAIYATRSWSLEEYLQSQDRLHRIGQTGTVSIIHLLAEGSIDQDIAQALVDKQELADDLTGDRARKLAARILGL